MAAIGPRRLQHRWDQRFKLLAQYGMSPQVLASLIDKIVMARRTRNANGENEMEHDVLDDS